MYTDQGRRWPVAVIAAALLPGLGLSGCHHVDAATGQVGLTAWSVPAGALKARIQVRLAPREPVRTAVLSASSPGTDIHFQPTRFMLSNLAPPSYPGNNNHNPPALGKTILRTFLVSVPHRGDYAVQIRLRWDGHVETRNLKLHFTEAQTP